jgi:hypothetical protein
VALLATAPSIGPVTASAIVATVDDITRFHSAHQFEAFIGLVPGERSSGEKRRVGRITKAGNSRVRYLLVEAGWRILRSKSDNTAALRAWALTIAARRGKRIAVVALARRLAGVVYARVRRRSWLTSNQSTGNVARTYRVNEVEATFDLAGRTIAIASIERSAVSYNSSLGAGPYKSSH